MIPVNKINHHNSDLSPSAPKLDMKMPFLKPFSIINFLGNTPRDVPTSKKKTSVKLVSS